VLPGVAAARGLHFNFAVKRSILVAAFVLLPCACSKETPPVAHDPTPAPTDVDQIPAGPVSGKIDGQPFSLKAAKYYVDVRPGYEKTEIYLASTAMPSACDDLGPAKATTVWLRRTGPGGPKPETVHFGPKDKVPWEAHYDIYQDGKWSGNGTASALVSIQAVAPDAKVAGRLAVNFGDATGSGVQGEFSAVYCAIHIDTLVRGTHAMEVAGAGKGADWQPAEGAAATPEGDGGEPASGDAAAD
jgi:hypothetical protein